MRVFVGMYVCVDVWCVKKKKKLESLQLTYTSYRVKLGKNWFGEIRTQLKHPAVSDINLINTPFLINIKHFIRGLAWLGGPGRRSEDKKWNSKIQWFTFFSNGLVEMTGKRCVFSNWEKAFGSKCDVFIWRIHILSWRSKKRHKFFQKTEDILILILIALSQLLLIRYYNLS